MKSLNTLTAYVFGVLTVWAVIIAVGYFRNGSTPGHPILHVFGGFLLGMLSMYIATRVYPR
jgi:RsiW-degrading membrane proteinase PrsW (M82 family)